MNTNVYYYQMKHGFSEFKKEIRSLEDKILHCPGEKFAQEEMLRFYLIGNTVLQGFPDLHNYPDQRIITHPLLRTLLEGWIWVSYIFGEDDEDTKINRFNELLNGFKLDYSRLIDDRFLPHKDQLPSIPNGENWQNSRRPKSTKDLLVAIKNEYGHRLDYLYILYRVTSFDIHAKASEALFNEAFGGPCSFARIKPDKIINLMAGGYSEIREKHNL